jgi:uncharacterized membrane protein
VRWIEFLLSGVCHQLASHSLVYGGAPLPLCARCSGTFVGAMLTLVTLWLLGEGRRSELPTWRRAVPLILLVLVWAVDGLNSLLYTWGIWWLYTPTNTLRLITGTGTGLAVGAVLYPAAHYALWRDTRQETVLAERSHGLVVTGVAGAFVLLSLTWTAAPRWLVWSLHVGSVLVLFTLVNALLVALLIHGRGVARRAREMVPYLALGLTAGVIEMGAMALLRTLVERLAI